MEKLKFITDEIYRNLTGLESVHLADYPKANPDMYQDKIEERMDLVRNLISLGRNAREEAKIKVRQPISKVILDGKNKSLINDLVELIKEELNVKEVVFEDNLEEYIKFIIKPNFKEVGKVLGSKMKEFQEILKSLPEKEILKLKDGTPVEINLSNELFTITKEMIDIRVESKEGFNASYVGNDFVILNTTLDEELINEGLARETISKIQQIRKNNGFDIADRVIVYYEADESYTKSLEKYLDFIKEETLATDIIKASNLTDEYDVNEYKVLFKVEKK